VTEADSISWPALVVLMALGDGPEPSISGVVHVREVEPDDAQTEVVLPDVGPVRIKENRHRVAKRGSLMRREHDDGRPMAIYGHETKWIWLEGAALPTAFQGAAWGWDDQRVVQRRALASWEGDDFTHPTGPARATTFLGRAAWSVELAPPAHKPFPLTLVVDAETGIVLQERNDGFGSVTEWDEISFGSELPDELFVWTGDALEPSDGRAERERVMASRRDWLAARGIDALSWTVDAALSLHDWDDETGEFEAGLHFHLTVAVVRRRRNDTDWDTRNNWPHEYRWSDDEWDWYLGASEELRDDEFRTFRAQLGSPVTTD
jgi:hypothetical protein